MASYIGSYTNDISVIYECVLLNVYLYINGVRVNTTFDRDKPFLPEIFKNNTKQYLAKEPYCSLDYRQIRRAQCYISDDTFIEIPCIFMGGSIEIEQFFQDLNRKSFRLVNLVGESIPYSYGIYFDHFLRK